MIGPPVISFLLGVFRYSHSVIHDPSYTSSSIELLELLPFLNVYTKRDSGQFENLVSQTLRLSQLETAK